MAEKIQNAQKSAGNNSSASADQSAAQQGSGESESNPRYPDLLSVAGSSSGGGVNSQILRIDPDLWWVPMVT